MDSIVRTDRAGLARSRLVAAPYGLAHDPRIVWARSVESTIRFGVQRLLSRSAQKACGRGA